MLFLSLLSLASPLHDAVEANNATLLREALSKTQPFEMDQLDDNSLTPLQLAAYHGHLETADELLSAGAPVDTQARGGMAALHWAAGQGHTELVQALLSKGASQQLCDDDKHTALHFAASRGHDDVLQLLLAPPAGDPPSAALLDAPSSLGVTPLQMAAEKGQASAVEQLLAAGADMALARDERKISALHGAAAMGHTAVVQALIVHARFRGIANALERSDALGRTPLHLSAAMGQAEAVEALVAAGAALEARDKDGRTPRKLAERSRQTAVVAALRAAGAVPGSWWRRWWKRLSKR